MHELFELIDESRILTGEKISSEYLTDSVTGQAGKARAVVFPKTTEEVQRLALLAQKNSWTILVRGAGTGLTGATLPVSNELIIDVSQMNQILSFDEETLTLFVEPGVTLADIQAYVEERGYFYPPDPGSKEASIGGTVATNAGGMRAVKYGVTRDYVQQIEVVLLSGERLHLGSLTIKNSSGYDLKDLFIGSEGTLGITTKIALKIIPRPKVDQSILVAFDDLKELSQAVLDILKSSIDPTAVEFFERDAIDISCKALNITFPLETGQAFLLLTLDGTSRENLHLRFAELHDITVKNNQKGELLLEGKKQASDIWAVRGGIVSGIETFSQQEPIDIVVPVNKIPEMIVFMKCLAKESGLPFICFGHAGDGNIHACILRQSLDEDNWHRKLEEVLTRLYGKVAELHGLPSAEHGIGLLKKTYFLKESDQSYIHYLRAIKAVFDPDNRLNPTKLF